MVLGGSAHPPAAAGSGPCLPQQVAAPSTASLGRQRSPGWGHCRAPSPRGTAAPPGGDRAQPGGPATCPLPAPSCAWLRHSLGLALGIATEPRHRCCCSSAAAVPGGAAHPQQPADPPAARCAPQPRAAAGLAGRHGPCACSTPDTPLYVSLTSSINTATARLPAPGQSQHVGAGRLPGGDGFRGARHARGLPAAGSTCSAGRGASTCQQPGGGAAPRPQRRAPSTRGAGSCPFPAGAGCGDGRPPPRHRHGPALQEWSCVPGGGSSWDKVQRRVVWQGALPRPRPGGLSSAPPRHSLPGTLLPGAGVARGRRHGEGACKELVLPSPPTSPGDPEAGAGSAGSTASPVCARACASTRSHTDPDQRGAGTDQGAIPRARLVFGASAAAVACWCHGGRRGASGGAETRGELAVPLQTPFGSCAGTVLKPCS